MRKTKDITITPETCPSAEGRDYGKTFRLTEMSAFDAEGWGTQATLALIPRLSREVSPEIAEELRENPGMASVSRVGLLLSGVSFPETKALMDRLMKCVQVVTSPDARIPPRALNGAGAEDIEEVETIRYLREEVLSLHTGFTLAASLFSLLAVAATTPAYEPTSTSPSPSAPSSPPVSPRSSSSRRSTG